MGISEDKKKIIFKKDSGDLISPPGERKIFTKQEIDASKTAQNLLDDANKKAQEIISEKERLVEEAKKEGFQEGYKEGLNSINKILLDLQNLKNDTILSVESEIVKLSFKIARKILGYELEKNDEAIVSIIREVLKSSRHQKSIKISVNPKDYDLISDNKEKLLSVLTKTETFLIEPKDGIQRNGCEIETEIGTVTADLDIQLETLESLLLHKEV